MLFAYMSDSVEILKLNGGNRTLKTSLVGQVPAFNVATLGSNRESLFSNSRVFQGDKKTNN